MSDYFEREEQVNKMLKNFMHNIGTPISVVTGNIFLLNHKLTDETDLSSTIDKQFFIDSRKYLSRIHASLGIIVDMKERYMRHLVERTPQLETVRLNELISKNILGDLIPPSENSQVKTYNVLFGNLNKEVIFNGDKVEINSDPLFVENIFQNVYSNALKYCEKRINIDLEDIGSRVLVTIEDDGKGILLENKNDIFIPFVRESAPSKDQSIKKGSGIGLASAKKFADQIGATIDFQSEYGKGTTFYLTFNK